MTETPLSANKTSRTFKPCGNRSRNTPATTHSSEDNLAAVGKEVMMGDLITVNSSAKPTLYCKNSTAAACYMHVNVATGPSSAPPCASRDRLDDKNLFIFNGKSATESHCASNIFPAGRLIGLVKGIVSVAVKPLNIKVFSDVASESIECSRRATVPPRADENKHQLIKAQTRLSYPAWPRLT
ncbi:hypothetical protein INR49_002117 [Caranx melampygus]|nr:hypothetical protein INR49_002117 [Caranx melampygus]